MGVSIIQCGTLHFEPPPFRAKKQKFALLDLTDKIPLIGKLHLNRSTFIRPAPNHTYYQPARPCDYQAHRVRLHRNAATQRCPQTRRMWESIFYALMKLTQV